MAIIRKGVADIKSMTGMQSKKERSRMYFKLGAAALEHERRLRERDSAFGRIDEINKRLNEVEGSMDKLKSDIEQCDADEPPKSPLSVARGQRSSADSAAAARGAEACGIKIRY